ncbi:MAG: hypothetical protein ACJAV7_002661 [Flavobacteriales bacterium]|jgi:hypothetical protein
MGMYRTANVLQSAFKMECPSMELCRTFARSAENLYKTKPCQKSPQL